MPPSLDLNLISLTRQDGKELASLPGLYMALPPRQATRSRSDDRLVLFFNMLGNAPLSDQQQSELLIRLAQSYYKTAGSITNAMRTTAEGLNQILLERNLRSTSSGKHCTGLLATAVLRDTRLILGHCGPVHAFLVTTDNIEHFQDPDFAGKGLGVGKAFNIRFYQAEIKPADLLVLSVQPPAAWNESVFLGAKNLGMEALRRKLLSLAGEKLDSIIMQAAPGTGKIRLLRPRPPVQMAQPPAAASTPSSAAPTGAAHLKESAQETTFPKPDIHGEVKTQTEPAEAQASLEPEQVSSEPSAGLAQAAPQAGETLTQPETQAAPVQSTQDAAQPPVEPIIKTPAAKSASVESTSGTARPAMQRPKPAQQPARPARPPSRRAPAVQMPKISGGPFLRALGIIWAAFMNTLRLAGAAIAGLLKRVLPDESIFTIPASTMILLAIPVALIIATIGGVVYVQRGRRAEYLAKYNQAVIAARQAAQVQDKSNEYRTDWETVLDLLDQADSYSSQPTTESASLRLQARSALDSLDGILRLDFQPAVVGGLGDQMYISRIVANDREIYLLNKNTGRVMRAVITGQGYEVDSEFVCGPNPNVGPLVDIVPLPKGNNLKATILGMDAHANLMFCIPGDQPVSKSPAPPQGSWINPLALIVDSVDLYVLDPLSNGVWFYRNMDTNLEKEPHLFFGSEVPNMKDVIDMTVYNDDLFLLHDTGQLTRCTYSGYATSPTRCDDPASFTDPRQGRKNGPQISDARFSQIVATLPPDPSLYLLDPANQAIYHFSMQLSFQRQIRPQAGLSKNDASAFAVGPNHLIFIAFGSSLFYATLP